MDKFYHFISWYAGALTIALFFGEAWAFWIMFSLGVGKEVCDIFKKDGKFDPLDLIADMLGIFTALGVHKLL